MTQLGRRALLQAGATMLGGAMLPASARAQENPGRRTYEFVVKDIVYQRGTKQRLARLYQPAGTGPFPAVLQVHGGAWNNKDRTDGQNTALDLAAAGIVVLSMIAATRRRRPIRPRCRTSITASAGSRPMPASSAAARAKLAPTARRAAAIRSCWPRSAPNAPAIARCRWRKRPSPT